MINGLDVLMDAAFSPNGKLIVTASWDKTARIWDAATGQQVGDPFEGHDDVVWSAAFSPDGTRVLTASKDATARIWDVASRRMVAELVSDDPVRRAAFSPDGKRVVTAPLNKSVRVWDVFPDTTALVSTARTAAPRCLTPAERETFFLSREPPAWCVEMAKWPYDAPAWKQWLADKRGGKTPPLPADVP